MCCNIVTICGWRVDDLVDVGVCSWRVVCRRQNVSLEGKISQMGSGFGVLSVAVLARR